MQNIQKTIPLQGRCLPMLYTAALSSFRLSTGKVQRRRRIQQQSSREASPSTGRNKRTAPRKKAVQTVRNIAWNAPLLLSYDFNISQSERTIQWQVYSSRIYAGLKQSCPPCVQPQLVPKNRMGNRNKIFLHSIDHSAGYPNIGNGTDCV